MTEAEARAWMVARFGSAAVDRVDAFLAMVLDENERQNLIAPSTAAHMWARHAVDSAQLVTMVEDDGLWVDVGTGGGFPGVIAAILRSSSTLLVEPRRRRADFLDDAIRRLDVHGRAKVQASTIERVTASAAVISARAVASVEKLLRAAAQCATSDTCWLLPRGSVGDGDLVLLERKWKGMFHVEQSVTNPGSAILVLKGEGLR